MSIKIMQVTDAASFKSALAKIKNTGDAVAQQIQVVCDYCHQQANDHMNFSPIADVLNTLNECRMDIRRDVRAYLDFHIPCKITFSKTHGFKVKKDVNGRGTEDCIPFGVNWDDFERPRRDTEQEAMNVADAISRIDKTINSILKRVEDRGAVILHLQERFGAAAETGEDEDVPFEEVTAEAA